jgi:Phytanoyl-CoA dioxygenase (PhyH).
MDLVISKSDLDVYNSNGFLVLEDFVDVRQCDDLRKRAEELVQEFEPAGLISLFSTHEQSRVVMITFYFRRQDSFLLRRECLQP